MKTLCNWYKLINQFKKSDDVYADFFNLISVFSSTNHYPIILVNMIIQSKFDIDIYKNKEFLEEEINTYQDIYNSFKLSYSFLLDRNQEVKEARYFRKLITLAYGHGQSIFFYQKVPKYRKLPNQKQLITTPKSNIEKCRTEKQVSINTCLLTDSSRINLDDFIICCLIYSDSDYYDYNEVMEKNINIDTIKYIDISDKKLLPKEVELTWFFSYPFTFTHVCFIYPNEKRVEKQPIMGNGEPICLHPGETYTHLRTQY